MNFTLSLAAVDILREQYGIESTYPFEIPNNGVTREERSLIRSAVLADLEHRGLARRGKPVDEVESAMSMMSRHDVSLAMVCLAGNDEVRALVAGNDSRAVRICQTGQLLAIDRTGDGVVRGMLDLLPDEKPGPGHSVTFRADEPSDQAAAYLKRPRRRLGQLSLATGSGAQRTWPMELTWFDTDAGRYVSYARDNWITYTPATRTRIATILSSPS
ncbi:MAG: ESX secretion-associated protein EspG [Kibdelosporangium sp.]